ncbi:NUDIX domain-containing protein [Sporolactobacillus sp. CPB3-1]|uniref:8-oxo-dGTP diphosphatase n=1 Tax=Sporolactobacillus mangiferae TaxID=2940498 RepID=A0ABT0MBI8_9BACL|nr:NUDIX domain-containing protein [Sporolactobacillus mangiferae]MCL1632231.1 NUDIX domain-containing protein [Sporolactobacillus mangiferae]
MFYVVVEAAIYQNDRWLIIKRSEQEPHAAGLLALVGGKVDLDDPADNILEQALRREIREEIALEVGALRYIKSVSFPLPDDQIVLETIFLCRPLNGTPHAVSADEVAEIYWMTTEEVLHHPEAPDYLRDQIRCAAQLIKQEPG